MKSNPSRQILLWGVVLGTVVTGYHTFKSCDEGRALKVEPSEGAGIEEHKGADLATGMDTELIAHPVGCGCALHRAPESDQLLVSKQPRGTAGEVSRLLGSTEQAELLNYGNGEVVRITLPGGQTVEGIVDFVNEHNGQHIAVSGSLRQPHKGKFYFSKELEAGLAGEFSGAIHYDDSDEAYAVATNAAGEIVLQQVNVHSVLCRSYGSAQEAQLQAAALVEEIPEDHPTDVFIPDYQNGIVPLESLPGATAVAYLDFDGEEGPFLSWGDFDALPAGTSVANTKDIWRRVAEDFAPFNINVTTDLAVYEAAPANSRIRCIVTPTTDASPGAGGVAYLGDFNRSHERPCWAFHTSSNKSTAEKISHEIGHTLGLRHDGRTTPEEGYYIGHGNGDVGWAPIMGAGYYEVLTQWSKGEYLNADRTEDDLAIITTNNNNVNYRTDDHGDTLATASWINVASNSQVNDEGIIETGSDVDGFRFTAAGTSAISLSIDPISGGPNLDILAELVNSSGTVLSSSNPDTGLDATISTSVSAGEYFVRVSGVGRGSATADGYTDYGSLGQYKITGSLFNVVQPARFTIAETLGNGATVGTVSGANNHGGDSVSYAIDSGNTGGAFAISNSGVLTVANAGQINYETVSTSHDDPAEFELEVTITNATTPALTETVRVMVTVTDVNEAPQFPASAVTASLEERRPVGTSVWTATATDPDNYDGLSYAITGGNSAGVFTIDAAGVVKLAQEVDYEVNQQFTLTISATDRSGLSDTATLTVNITDLTEAAEPAADSLALNASSTATTVSVLLNDVANSTQATTLQGVLDSVVSYDAGTGSVVPNPTTQGWVEADSEFDDDASVGNSTGLGSQNHNGSGLNAWVVTDNTTFTGFTTYTATPSVAAVTNGQSNGWLLETKMRFVDDFGGTKSTVLIFGDGTRRYVVFFNLNVNGELFAELVGDGGGTYTLTPGNPGTTSFHDIALQFDPANSSVAFVVDGIRYDAGNWTGQANSFRGVQFGNGSTGGKGSAAFHSVEWSTIEQNVTLDSGATVAVQGSDLQFDPNGAYNNVGSANPAREEVRYLVGNGSGIFGVGTLNVTVTGTLPEFTTDTIVLDSIFPAIAYSGSIASYGVDADDVETFSKVSGPAWLSVAADGSLSGTPSFADGGQNDFIVRVSDGKGNSDDATLQITVNTNGSLLSEGFESYEVANPSNFSVAGVATGNWSNSTTANNATRIFDTGNYGGTRLWISNVDGATITSKGIALPSNAHFTFSAVLLAETSSATATVDAEYDLLLGQTAATATSILGGAQSVIARGDDYLTADSKADHQFSESFQTSQLNPGDKLFVRIRRIGGGSWFGADDVQVNLVGANTLPAVTAATFTVAENTAQNTAVGTVAASDADAGDTIVSFAITGGNAAGHFAINSSTGAITTTAVPLDYEVASSHVLTVSATDRSGQAGSASITVNVTNVAVSDDGDGDNLNDDWEMQHYSTTTGVTPTSDTDGDGFTAFEEMVFGTDPTAANGQDDVVSLDEIDDAGTKRVEVRFRRPKNYANLQVVYTLYSSANLADWTLESVTATSVTDDADGSSEWVSYRFPMNTAQPRFYEMRAASAE